MCSSPALAAISPCSSHVRRNWSPARYAAVADFAARDLGMQVVLTGGPSELERETGAAIQSLMSTTCINLIGADTLEQSKALLHRADLLISPDSGPVHIASALGTDVLGLYAATWSRRSGPFNSLDLCVDRFPQAARKYRKKEPDELPWGTRIEVPGVMDLVQVDDVIARLETWWQSRYLPQATPALDSSAGIVPDNPSAFPPSGKSILAYYATPVTANLPMLVCRGKTALQVSNQVVDVLNADRRATGLSNTGSVWCL
jgi:hypothetical protein